MGSFKDGTVSVAPLNTDALANHPRKDQIQKIYNEEVAAFKSGEKNFETIFTGPIKDNTGAVQDRGQAGHRQAVRRERPVVRRERGRVAEAVVHELAKPAPPTPSPLR